jgi:hypothetical protein
MAKAFRRYLDELASDARSYRSAVNRVFSRKLTAPRSCAHYFFEVLVRTSRLYGDYLLLRELERTVSTKPSAGKRAGPQHRLDKKSKGPDKILVKEFRVRTKLEERLKSLSCWSASDPFNAFAAENNLRTKADYVANLALHLPEIYAETIRVETYISQAQAAGGFTDWSLADLLVGLEHAAHHASYCRHALEVLSNEGSWRSQGD